MSKELKEQGYYKEKGAVQKLVNKYVAQIAMLKSGDLLQVGCLPPSPPPLNVDSSISKFLNAPAIG
jgi:hypothetical protein